MSIALEPANTKTITAIAEMVKSIAPYAEWIFSLRRILFGASSDHLLEMARETKTSSKTAAIKKPSGGVKTRGEKETETNADRTRQSQGDAKDETAEDELDDDGEEEEAEDDDEDAEGWKVHDENGLVESAEKEDDGRQTSGTEDLSCIDRFLRGDEESFVKLVLKYQNKVHNLCFRILGDRDEAMDMAQEVFITAHKSLGSFRGESLFSTWIFRVTVNHCKNRMKYLGRRRYYQSVSLDHPKEQMDGEILYDPEDDSPDPEQTMASDEIQNLIQTAIKALDQDHALVITLRDLQDLSYEEIADILDIKVGTVKSRIHRARNELKKKLEGRFNFTGR